MSCESNFHFQCELCDRKTNIEKVTKSKKSEFIDPWEGDIEIVDIAENEEADEFEEDLIKSNLINIAIEEDLETGMDLVVEESKDTKNRHHNAELLLQENIDCFQTELKTVDEQTDPKKEISEMEIIRNPFLKCRVMFSGYRCKDHVKIVMDLGGKLTSKLKNCSVMVTDRLRMTSKMLIILRKGVPVVSPAWVLACKEREGLVDPWDYVLKDQFMEKLWDFNLQESLKKENKNVFTGTQFM